MYCPVPRKYTRQPAIRKTANVKPILVKVKDAKCLSNKRFRCISEENGDKMHKWTRSSGKLQVTESQVIVSVVSSQNKKKTVVKFQYFVIYSI